MNDPVEEHAYRWHRRIVFVVALAVIISTFAWVVL